MLINIKPLHKNIISPCMLKNNVHFLIYTENYTHSHVYMEWQLGEAEALFSALCIQLYSVPCKYSSHAQMKSEVIIKILIKVLCSPWPYISIPE